MLLRFSWEFIDCIFLNFTCSLAVIPLKKKKKVFEEIRDKDFLEIVPKVVIFCSFCFRGLKSWQTIVNFTICYPPFSSENYHPPYCLIMCKWIDGIVASNDFLVYTGFPPWYRFCMNTRFTFPYAIRLIDPGSGWKDRIQSKENNKNQGKMSTSISFFNQESLEFQP